ncbi:hypothetical protein ACFE04_029973 [Oxalis oulophora]
MATTQLKLTMITLYLPLFFIIVDMAAARELRPSDHGLEYQTIAPPMESPKTKSFFKGNLVPNSSSTTLPNVTNSSDITWKQNADGGGGGGGHLRHVLVVVSVVCGGAGLALFIASGLVHVFRNIKPRAIPCTNIDLVINKK